MKKFKVVALGCRTNQYEAQAMRDQMLALGHVQAADDEVADIYVVNSCTVTEGADSSSRHMVRGFIRENPNAQVMVTGCLAERDPKSLEAIPGVTKVVPFQSTTVGEIEQAFKDSVDDYLEWCKNRGKEPEKSRATLT